jgi:hypothetical protein
MSLRSPWRRERGALCAGAILTLFVQAACSAKSTDIDATPLATEQDSCDRYVAAVRDAERACASGPVHGVTSPQNEAAVRERLSRACNAALAAPGQGVTRAQLDSCASALAGKCGQGNSCLPVHPTGSLPEGSACGIDSQCVSGYCQPADLEVRGVADARGEISLGPAPYLSAGPWPYASSRPQSCGKCTRRAPLGASCDPDQPDACEWDLYCKEGYLGSKTDPTYYASCVTTGSVEQPPPITPAAPPLREGDECRGSAKCGPGLVCMTSSDWRCRKVTFVPAGAVCDGSTVRCATGQCLRETPAKCLAPGDPTKPETCETPQEFGCGCCTRDACVRPNPEIWRCVDRRGEGVACDGASDPTEREPKCPEGTQCVRGACHVFDPATCF